MKDNVYQVPPPNCIQIEPTEGCSLACWFCALQVLRDNGADRDTQTNGKASAPYKFMTLETAERIAGEVARAGWNSRFMFAMHGEPTMHPHLVELVATFRKHNPKNSITVTTNGSGLVKDAVQRIEALFAAGVNALVFDDYAHADFVPRIRESFPLLSVPVYEYPRDKAKVNHNEAFYGKHVIVLECITHGNVQTHSITNQGGNSGTKKEKVARRCAKPFRELSFRWDGNVALCCDDWPGVYKIGSIHDMPLEDLWHHPFFDAARRRLYQKDRNFGPCRGCNVKTPRDGLLPDKLGKDTMPAPTDATNDLIVTALEGDPFTPRVKRTKAQSKLMEDLLQ